MINYVPVIGMPAIAKATPDLSGPEAEARTVTFRLSNYTTDAHQIVSKLASLARQYGIKPVIRNFVNGIIPRSVEHNDPQGLLASLTAFIRERVTYVPDPQGIEYVTSPERMIRAICATGRTTGDCDDQVLLLNSFLNSVGFSTYISGVKVNGNTEYYNHVISTIKLGGEMIDVDLCRPGTPFYQYGTDRIIYNSTP